jgi:hypothetical protein
MDLTMMERTGDRWEKMEGSCSTGQSPRWAVVPVEEEELEYTPRRHTDHTPNVAQVPLSNFLYSYTFHDGIHVGRDNASTLTNVSSGNSKSSPNKIKSSSPFSPSLLHYFPWD